MEKLYVDYIMFAWLSIHSEEIFLNTLDTLRAYFDL